MLLLYNMLYIISNMLCIIEVLDSTITYQRYIAGAYCRLDVTMLYYSAR